MVHVNDCTLVILNQIKNRFVRIKSQIKSQFSKMISNHQNLI